VAEISFCMITTFYPPANFGGDGIHVRRLASGLARRGHRVRVVHNPAAYRMLAPRGTEVGRPDDEGVEVIPAPGGALSTAEAYLVGRSKAATRSLTTLAADFDVVHFHNPSLLGGPGALVAGNGLRLYTTHEHWLLCPTHVLYRNNREVCTHKTCVTCTLAYRRPPQLWRYSSLLERSVAHVDALLCPSRFTAELHRASFPDAAIEVLPLPAPEARAEPEGSGRRSGRPYFLYAGRLETIKGIDRLVAAFGRVTGADLVVAGSGSLLDKVRDLAGTSAVRFVGRVPEAEVIELCASALAVVVPSVGYETFGGVAIEAMAVGTPAVVRALGPLPEVVECGGGLTFDTDDDMVRVMQRLVDDPVEASRLGKEAARVVTERFSEGLFFSRYFDVISRRAEATARPSLAQTARVACRSEGL